MATDRPDDRAKRDRSGGQSCEATSGESRRPEKESSFSARVFKAIGILFDVHLQFAQREAKSDLARVMSGVVLLVVGLVFVGFALAVGHVGVVMWLNARRGLPLDSAVLAVLAGDLALATLALLIGRARLRRPFLKETRGLVRKTVSALTGA